MYHFIEKIADLSELLTYLTTLIGGTFVFLKSHLESFIKKTQEEAMQAVHEHIDKLDNKINQYESQIKLIDNKVIRIEDEWKRILSDFKFIINDQFSQTRKDIREIRNLIMKKD